MLDLALLHAEELQARYQQTLFDTKYKYYHRFSTVNYYLELNANSDQIQMVSLEDDQIVGFLSTDLNRETNTAFNLNIIKFKADSQDFSADIFAFFIMLFTQFGIERVVWDVIIGNPAEKFYDYIAANYGGRIVGVFRNEARLADGKLYDVKYYEMYREEALQAVEDRRATGYTYRRAGVAN